MPRNEMKSHPYPEPAMPSVPYRQAPLVLLLLIVAVLAITWPWAQTFASAFLDHWDPPFHAWKLEYVARSIWSGHLVPPDGDTNMYYPYSGTLYFEALHWPQALVAAPLFGLFHLNPVLVYHLVLVFFWALAGLCTWMLMLALGSTRRSALLCALLFTILPYRTSYMVEFNMQLCFALPLFFFFLVRYFQQPSVRYACGLAVAWWLQASSELYQAVFLLLILPFPALALLAPNWRLLRSFRRFWLPAICAAAVGGTLTWIVLGPYLTMLNMHAVNRNLTEITHHVLEPLSYLRPGGRFHFLTPFDAKKDEMIVYPTLVLIALTCLHLVFDARRLSRLPVPRWLLVVRTVRWGALIGFFSLSFFIYYHGASAGLGSVYALLPVAAMLTSFLVLFHPTERNPATLFMTGFFAAAVFAFFLSMGPMIGIRHSEFAVFNWLYLWIYNHLLALQGFRVVSRFSIFLLLFMALAGALAWSQIERRWFKHGWRKWLWLAPLALAVPECLPVPIPVIPMPYPLQSPVIDTLDRLGKPYVIAMAPMGERYYDSRYMLQIARTDRLFVYAWGGAYPEYTSQVHAAMNPAGPDPVQACNLLRQLWPECLILEDKSITWHTRKPFNYAQLFSAETTVLAEDDRFVLMRINPRSVPTEEKIRLVRHDFLRQYPRVTFRARTAADVPAATLWLDLNGYVIGRWEIGPEARDFQVSIPDRYSLKITPNRFRFHATGNTPFFLDIFDLQPADASVATPADWPAAECPPWLGHLHQLPADAIPLNIQYPRGISILASEPVQTSAPVGGTLHFRHFIQCPRDLDIDMNTFVHSHLDAQDGRWIEEKLAPASSNDVNDIQCQIHPGIYALDQYIPLPERLGPGDYKFSVILRDREGKRIRGVQNGKSAKMFPVPVPVRIEPQASAGP